MGELVKENSEEEGIGLAGKVMLIGTAALAIGVFGFVKIVDSVRYSRYMKDCAAEAGISLEVQKEYMEKGVWIHQTDELVKANVTLDRLDALIEDGYKVDGDLCRSGFSPFNWAKYEAFGEAGFVGEEKRDYLLNNVSLEAALYGRELAERHDKDLIDRYLFAHTQLPVIESLIEGNISARDDRYGRLTKKKIAEINANSESEFNWEVYGTWLAERFSDREIEFCVLKNHPLEEAVRWRDTDPGYTVEEMHKCKKLPELLGVD